MPSEQTEWPGPTALGLPLGNHLKPAISNHFKTGPTEQTQNKSIYTLARCDSATYFVISLAAVYTGETWPEDTVTQGCDRSADQQPEWRGGESRPRTALQLKRHHVAYFPDLASYHTDTGTIQVLYMLRGWTVSIPSPGG
jgi:hypothetical protein